MELISFFSCVQRQDERQWAQTEAQEVPAQCEGTVLYWEVTEHCNRLPREVVASPSPDIFKIPPTQGVLGDPALWGGWTK